MTDIETRLRAALDVTAITVGGADTLLVDAAHSQTPSAI